MTLDRYSHALPTMQTAARARLDAILGRSADDPAAPAAPQASASKTWHDEEPAP